ncbi:MFS transporter [Alkalihalobacillus sp. AL-G]|uniref:MFS transporter n=1 Tax=Alkalihalobacillus sp. AL-G TaxID=2926399 RepID=UPI0027298634|nr:MFS transporter [Alkalihalobacillus sp. AL-G]WLD93109.1 MFS transporter [Alkalihalobacillus sp. AL-G]
MKELFLKNPSYLRLWIAQVISEIGDGITKTLIIFLVATLTQDPFMIGIVVFAQLLPGALFGSILGPIVDRFSKRNILVLMDLYRMGIVLLMIVFSDQAWLLILLIVLQGLGTALFEPARAASIPFLVDQEKIPQAVGLSQGTRQAMMIIGPAIAGLLLFISNTDIIFVIDAITYIVSAVVLFTITKLGGKASPEAGGESYLSSLKSGVVAIGEVPALRFLIVLLIPVTIAAGVLSTNISAMFLQAFDVPAQEFGYLQATVGAGAVLGSLLAPKLLKRLRPGIMLLASTGLIGAWMIVVLSLTQFQSDFGTFPIYVWACVVGFLNAMLNVPLSSLFLSITPQQFLGRGAAIFQSTVNFGMMGGILAGGYFAGLTDTIVTTAWTGVIMVVMIFIFPLFKGFKTLSDVGKEEKNPEVA